MDKNSLLEKLRTLDELYLIDLLDISSDDILDVFYDRIEERQAYIEAQIGEE
jgi:hypothetical protein